MNLLPLRIVPKCALELACRTVTRTHSTSRYCGHIPTTRLQKFLLAGGAAVSALLDPKRADMVAVLGETTGGTALWQMREQMANDKVGQYILENRPRVTADRIGMEFLREMPPRTFGRAYFDFMHSYEFSPDDRPRVKFVDDAELAYVMTRYRFAPCLFPSGQ